VGTLREGAAGDLDLVPIEFPDEQMFKGAVGKINTGPQRAPPRVIWTSSMAVRGCLCHSLRTPLVR